MNHLIEQVTALADLQSKADARPYRVLAQTLIVCGHPAREVAHTGFFGKEAANADFLAAAGSLDFAALLAAVQTLRPAASEVIDVDTQRYEIQCRKFGTSEWQHAALAYTEAEAQELLAQVENSWPRHEHRIVSTTVIKRVHPAAPLDAA